MPAGIHDMTHSLFLRFAGLLLFQELAESKNGVERRAQLMTHSRQEIAFRAVGAISFVFRFVQILFVL